MPVIGTGVTVKTYKVSDALNVARKFAKNIPDNEIIVSLADMVSSEMWSFYPWKDSVTTIADSTIPLVDGVQDYDVPVNFAQLRKASIVCTSNTPEEWRELDVRANLSVNLVPRNYYLINCVAFDEGTGCLRLESAIQVGTGNTFELRGEYTINPTKITAVTDQLWFDDKYFYVFVQGLIYQLFKLADDERVGTVQFVEGGRPVYTGQYATYMAALHTMAAKEDFPGVSGFFPSNPLGLGKDMGGFNIFGS